MHLNRAVAVLCVALSFPSFAGKLTLIRAGTLIDPESGTAVRDQIILIEDKTIRAVGHDLVVPPNASVIDLSKAAVLPGLFDAHTHLCANVDPKWDLGDFWIHAMQWPTGYRALLGAHHAKEMLEAGFTTVRDLGNAGDYADRDLEKAIRFGIAEGPTMIFAGRIIGPFGGQFWDTPSDRNALNHPEYYFADSRDEMRKAVRENIYFGAKVIKVLGDAAKSYSYSEEDLRFIVQEARAAWVPVAVHVTKERSAHNAIAAGVASIEHAWQITDADLALAKKNGVALVSTDVPVRVLRDFGMEEDWATKLHARYVDRTRRAFKSGVTLVFGTDIMVDEPGSTRGSVAASYVDSYVEAGVPAKTILQAMTINAARLMGVEKERGAIRPGMAADIIATSGSPLDDIGVLKHVTFVMRNGEVVPKPR
jgi:imidazolonepropionase-like amidohydrolase